jgi:hypothetical protein
MFAAAPNPSLPQSTVALGSVVTPFRCRCDAGNCSGCPKAMGYGFIEVTRLKAPSDPGLNYKKPSKPGDVPA